MNTATFGSIKRFLCAAPLAVLFALSMAAYADPPSRVGRVSFLQGKVSFFMDREEGWQKAQINFPVTSENSLWTEHGGRAEVRIGASALRIDDGSLLDFVRIVDDQTQTFLQRGALNLRLRSDDRTELRSDGDNFRVETSEGQFVFSDNGRFRIDVSPENAETRVSVFVGHVRFESRDNRLSVEAGKALIVRGSANGEDFRFEPALESAFDRWAEARDQNWNKVHTRYVQERIISPYMTGYEDLDGYGDWIDDGEYGRLWTPRVVVSGWAPYRYGRWTHVQPWGYTWVDDAPWGFAPFHYGRWVFLSHRTRWAWWPGPYVRHPVYAPALVAWFNRPGVSISISSGPSVGWFPLAPREHYLPRYSNNAVYIRNINYITNNVTVINPPARYANQLPGATVVLNNVFHGGQPIGRNISRVPPAVIAAQTPGTGVDFGPRHNRQDSGYVPRDRRGEERRPPPTSPVPPSPLPPVLPAPAPGRAPPHHKPPPVPVTSGALPVGPAPVPGSGGQWATPTQPHAGERLPAPPAPVSPSMGSRPVAPPAAPAIRDNATPPRSNDDGSRNNMQRPRRDGPAIERSPVQPVPHAGANPVERSIGDRAAPAVRVQPNQGEPRATPRQPSAPAQDGKPVPPPAVKASPSPTPTPAAAEPKPDLRNKPREVER